MWMILLMPWNGFTTRIDTRASKWLQLTSSKQTLIGDRLFLTIGCHCFTMLKMELNQKSLLIALPMRSSLQPQLKRKAMALAQAMKYDPANSAFFIEISVHE